MNVVVFLIVGGVIGWLASLLLHSRTQHGIILNILVGLIGGVIAGLIFGHGVSSANPLDLTGVLWAIVGAVVLLAVVNLVRKATVR